MLPPPMAWKSTRVCVRFCPWDGVKLVTGPEAMSCEESCGHVHRPVWRRGSWEAISLLPAAPWAWEMEIPVSYSLELTRGCVGMAESCARGGSVQVLGKNYLPCRWSRAGTNFIKRWLVPLKFSRAIWITLLVISFNSDSQTLWSLWEPFN